MFHHKKLQVRKRNNFKYSFIKESKYSNTKRSIHSKLVFSMYLGTDVHILVLKLKRNFAVTDVHVYQVTDVHVHVHADAHVHVTDVHVHATYVHVHVTCH